MTGLDLATRVSTLESYKWDEGVEPCRSPSETRGRRAAVSRGRLRFRHQAQHPSQAGAIRNARHGRAGAYVGAKTCSRSSPTASSSRTVPAIPSRSSFRQAQVRKLVGKTPIFGICLGHQILGRALGGKTYKLKFGHRGANHPVLNKVTNKVEITSHNHGFAVDPDSLKRQRCRADAHQPERRDARRFPPPTLSGVLRPVSSRGRSRSARFVLPVRRFREDHEREQGSLTMPRRNDIHRILIIGSGPIVIGQACEFDYSGAQACKALRARRLRGRADQFESGDDHDGSESGRSHVCRAAERRVRRRGDSQGAAGRAALDSRRSDRSESRRSSLPRPASSTSTAWS